MVASFHAVYLKGNVVNRIILPPMSLPSLNLFVVMECGCPKSWVTDKYFFRHCLYFA